MQITLFPPFSFSFNINRLSSLVLLIFIYFLLITPPDSDLYAHAHSHPNPRIIPPPQCSQYVRNVNKHLYFSINMQNMHDAIFIT